MGAFEDFVNLELPLRVDVSSEPTQNNYARFKGFAIGGRGVEERTPAEVLSDIGAAASDHSSRHENGGADEISVAGLSGLLADDQNPTAHASDHENGGSDEIGVAGLSGLLADNQNPTPHASEHTDGTDDIQDATAGQKGLMTAAFASKLDGIEAGADATEAFKTISCPAGTNPVADSGEDTLTLAAGSSKISITGDSGADSVTLDVVEANIDHTAIDNIGTNSHADIDTHIADTSGNPHGVDEDDVGHDTAQWNADRLQGRAVQDHDPQDEEVLTWNNSESRWEPAAASGGVSGPVSSTDHALARWDGAGGDTLQDSDTTLDESENLTGLANVGMSGGILDANGNELIELGTTASAVNQVKISNAATTVGPTIEAEGETNVDLTVKSKGSGQTIVGLAGDIELGDGTLRTMRPNTDEKINLGSASYRFNEVYLVSLKPETAPTYTPANVTTDRAFDADTVTIAKLADVFGTLIADLQSLGVLS